MFALWRYLTSRAPIAWLLWGSRQFTRLGMSASAMTVTIPGLSLIFYRGGPSFLDIEDSPHTAMVHSSKTPFGPSDLFDGHLLETINVCYRLSKTRRQESVGTLQKETVAASVMSNSALYLRSAWPIEGQ
jgi:hypothetical protein